MATRAEMVGATRGRYAAASRGQKKQILDEFVAVTGFHRKHAMRLLRGRGEPKSSGPRLQRRLKIWRSKSAHEMIFGAAAAQEPSARAAELVD